jgi:hypothetical protein
VKDDDTAEAAFDRQTSCAPDVIGGYRRKASSASNRLVDSHLQHVNRP